MTVCSFTPPAKNEIFQEELACQPPVRGSRYGPEYCMFSVCIYLSVKLTKLSLRSAMNACVLELLVAMRLLHILHPLRIVTTT